MKKLLIFLLSFTLVMLLFISLNRSASANALPELVFLGEGPATFETPLDNFIIKTTPFDFRFEFGPTYEAQAGERVWGSRGTNQAPPAEWEVTEDLGPVEAGCIVKYIGIDDDLDNRVNEFRLNGQLVETVTQGMVFRGSFVAPQDGNLVFIARDSVGGYFSPCDERLQPTATPTETLTETPTPTNTATPSTSPTATATSSTPGPSPTPTATSGPTITTTPGPSPSATPTDLPFTATATSNPPTATPRPTETRRPRENACLRINFEVAGQEAARGLYVVQETGGRVLATWFAENGWRDSGWIRDIDISFENVYVQVLYYSQPDATPVVMKILNPAPGTPYGWLSWGVCHAIEVAWPDDIATPAGLPQTVINEFTSPPAAPAPTATPGTGSQGSTIGASLSN